MAHAKLDYSGQPFARPAGVGAANRLRFKLVAFVKPAAIGATLLGQDSVGVTSMSRGLVVYCGYEGGTLGYANGRYTTMGQVYSVWPGKKYLSVGRDAIDIEPGLASPGDAPNFVRNAHPSHTSKPVVYCSAGDLSAVIGALTNAGIARSKYYVWSAHWTGQHICGPATCGYPQADATQYGSNNSFDSDIFAAYMFGPVSDPKFPLSQGTVDATTNGPVRKLQARLNVWRVTIGQYPQLPEDGDFGPGTKAAVTAAQVHFGQRGVTAGTCNSALYTQLLATPPVGPPPPPPVKPVAPLTLVPHKSVTYSLTVDRSVPGYTGVYATQLAQVGGNWLVNHNTPEAVFTVAVPGPGTYKATTGGPGLANTVKTVVVA